MANLNSLPKILAERAVPHQPECDVHVCRCTERWYAARNRAYAVVREAIEKTLDEAASAGALAGGKWGQDVRAHIEALKP